MKNRKSQNSILINPHRSSLFLIFEFKANLLAVVCVSKFSAVEYYKIGKYLPAIMNQNWSEIKKRDNRSEITFIFRSYREFLPSKRSRIYTFYKLHFFTFIRSRIYTYYKINIFTFIGEIVENVCCSHSFGATLFVPEYQINPLKVM